MTAVRRVYVYAVAYVSLLMLAFGVSGLGRTLLQTLITSSSATIRTGIRADVATNGALVLVGLPVWLLHWWLANRNPDLDERASALRRLYVYGVLASMAIGIASAAQDILEGIARWLLPEVVDDSTPRVLEEFPWLIVAGVLWIFHQRVAARDRVLASERGGSATLRRWYVYGVAFIALMYLLHNTARIFRITWETIASGIVDATITVTPAGIAGASATALVALVFWVSHWRLWVVQDRSSGTRPPTRATENEQLNLPVLGQDLRSILRPLFLFASLAVVVTVTLWGGAQLLYYALGRLLGVERPGGVGGNFLVAMAGPMSAVVVYGLGWLYQQRALAAQADAQEELPRQAGVRRLYTYAVALVALATVATGAGGVLWTLADLATNAPRTVDPTDWWRNQLSLFVTFLAVGLPVWLAHWGPVSKVRGQGLGVR
ncbi:MAG TPA: DUF5671 domain-containing protein, partial [Chloroflexota bacterium]|nr:DUF5671 domain-containing protein [Chloroflexota bacterium]